jgi:hypothetical protein
MSYYCLTIEIFGFWKNKPLKLILMSKEKTVEKAVKKAPVKTLKEKRLAKEAKREDKKRKD